MRRIENLVVLSLVLAIAIGALTHSICGWDPELRIPLRPLLHAILWWSVVGFLFCWFLVAIILIIKKKNFKNALVDLSGGSLAIGLLLFFNSYGNFVVSPGVALCLVTPGSAFLFSLLYHVNCSMVHNNKVSLV